MVRLSVIDRYMLKRVAWPLGAGILIGTAAQLLERLIGLLDLVANRGGPLTLMLKMLATLVPQYLTVIIPAAFFVAILYATLRMSNDSELDIIRGSGISLRRLAELFGRMTARLRHELAAGPSRTVRTAL
jgi:lipopolysaccharide export system permease protein